MALGSLISMKDKLLELPGSIPGVLLIKLLSTQQIGSYPLPDSKLYKTISIQKAQMGL